MKTIEELQKIVDKIQLKYSDETINVSNKELIEDLMNYVDSSNHVKVVSNSKVVVDFLKFKGYKEVTELSEENRANNLFLCIIGNFLSSNGNPPPNVMARFCEQYLE